MFVSVNKDVTHVTVYDMYRYYVFSTAVHVWPMQSFDNLRMQLHLAENFIFKMFKFHFTRGASGL